MNDYPNNFVYIEYVIIVNTIDTKIRREVVGEVTCSSAAAIIHEHRYRRSRDATTRPCLF